MKTAKIAFVFPGQGSQTVGMLDAYADSYPLVAEIFEEASDALGRDLWTLVHKGPSEQLALTENTQPAMLVSGYAVWRIWQLQSDLRPIIMAGHSLGEYTALVASGSLAFAEAVKLVADRARYMQEAVPSGQGGIAAILGMQDAAIEQLCVDLAGNQVLQPVNYNAPGQVAVAGHQQAVQRLVEAAPRAGARKAIVLPISVPVHSTLMTPAAERMAQRLQTATIVSPKIPVLHNYHVQTEKDPEQIRQVLAHQINSPVPWVKTISSICESGVSCLLECGPGKTLTGLNKRINRVIPTYPLATPDLLVKALQAVSELRTTAEYNL